MESFRAAFDRLTRQLVADVVEAVRSELSASVWMPARIVRRRVQAVPAPVSETQPVVVRHFEIPVGRPRSRRPRVPRPPRVKSPVPPPPQAVKFEVVPHPERTNRRLVLTRLG